MSIDDRSFAQSFPYPLALYSSEQKMLWCNEAWHNEVAVGKLNLSEISKVLTTALKENQCRYDSTLSCDFRLHKDENGETKVWVTNFTGSPIAAARAPLGSDEISMMRLTELSEMAAGIAHEINNPLTVVYARAYSLLEKVKAQVVVSPENLQKDLEKMLSNSERILKIVRGMRTFSRDASEDPKLKFKAREAVNDALALLVSVISDYGYKVDVIEMGPEVQITGRITQIVQVVLNIVKNGIDASKTVPNPWVRIVIGTNDIGPFIKISDCGDGVPLEIEQRIFAPFFTTKPPGSGVGLGLSVSHKIMQDHGGKISIDRSEQSCFHLQFSKTGEVS